MPHYDDTIFQGIKDTRQELNTQHVADANIFAWIKITVVLLEFHWNPIHNPSVLVDAMIGLEQAASHYRKRWCLFPDTCKHHRILFSSTGRSADRVKILSCPWRGLQWYPHTVLSTFSVCEWKANDVWIVIRLLGMQAILLRNGGCFTKPMSSNVVPQINIWMN